MARSDVLGDAVKAVEQNKDLISAVLKKEISETIEEALTKIEEKIEATIVSATGDNKGPLRAILNWFRTTLNRIVGRKESQSNTPPRPEKSDFIEKFEALETDFNIWYREINRIAKARGYDDKDT